MKHLLVATDGSACADRAVDYAAALSAETGAKLTIVHVTDDSALREDLLSQFNRKQTAWIHDQIAAQAAAVLRGARERAQRGGAKAIALDARNGDIAQTVLDVAAESGAEAIVVGKRGAGRVAGLLVGSISQKLISLAPCVVIVVP